MLQNRTLNLFLFFLFISVSTKMGLAAPAVQTPPSPSGYDCEQIKERVLGNLYKLREDSRNVDSACEASSLSPLNNQYKSQIGQRQGACQLSYGTIVWMTNSVDRNVERACGAVNEALRIIPSCEGQSGCPAAVLKFKEAQNYLKEAEKQIERGQHALEERQKANEELAAAYRRRIDEIVNDMGPMMPPKEGENPIRLIDPADAQAFGYQDPTDMFIKNHWRYDSLEGPSSAQRAYDVTFDNSDKTPANLTGLPQPLREMALATQATARAQEYSGSLKTQLSTISGDLSRQISTFENRKTNLASAPTDQSGGTRQGQPSRLASLSSAADKLTKVTAASQVLASAFSKMGANSNNGASSGSKAQAPAQLSNAEASQAMALDSESVSQASVGMKSSSKSAGSEEMFGEKARAGDENKDSAQNEILTSFTTYPNSQADRAHSEELSVANSGSSPQNVRNPASLSGASSPHSLEKEAAGGKDPKRADAGLFGGSGQGNFLAGGSIQGELQKSTASGKKMREILRRRLAERRARGEETAAAGAVDELLESMQSNPLDSGNNQSSGFDGSNQGEPQGRESDPLFQRVHQAHQRFILRETPQQRAEI